ncbi:hypothetical protein [Paracoccus aminovorans]|uniref:hypothetical protein n=1 Tax=Paracoccus aminovorans TaxID=34004 RepID=UPI0007864126|nr:hypothetical protein [Paracoccus aminovorans]MDQ7775884.1 hypothetical protein [Paracoccus aminovorans]
MTHPADLPLPANDQTEAVIIADDILRRVYAMPAPQQRRVVEWLRGHSDPGLRDLAAPLAEVLILRRLIGGEP